VEQFHNGHLKQQSRGASLMGRIPVLFCIAGINGISLFPILALSDAQFIGLAAAQGFGAVLFLVGPVLHRLVVAPADSLPAMIRYCLSVLHKSLSQVAALLMPTQSSLFQHRTIGRAAQTAVFTPDRPGIQVNTLFPSIWLPLQFFGDPSPAGCGVNPRLSLSGLFATHIL
jgi:hypothetical protein